MTLDELVNTLREEYKNLCDYLTDLDHDVTGLYEPGGSIAEVKDSLFKILCGYSRAMFAVLRYEEWMKEQDQ